MPLCTLFTLCEGDGGSARPTGSPPSPVCSFLSGFFAEELTPLVISDPLRDIVDPELRVGLPTFRRPVLLAPAALEPGSTEWVMDPSKWVAPSLEAVAVGLPLEWVMDPLSGLTLEWVPRVTPLLDGGGESRGSTILVRGAEGGVAAFCRAFAAVVFNPLTAFLPGRLAPLTAAVAAAGLVTGDAPM